MRTGNLPPINEIKISILDWGFLHSDATYDVVSAWKGAFFRLEDHLDRFETSLARLRLNPGHSRQQMADVLHECVARANLQDAYVEMLCTRGFALGSRDPRDAVNQFFAFAVPFGWILRPELWETGLHLWIAPQPRISPESLDPTVKNYHWLDMVMGQMHAYDRAQHPVGGRPNVNALLTDGRGNLAEGPGFNVFVVRNGVLYTPDTGVLHGVSRRTAIELAHELGYPLQVTPVPLSVLQQADEMFATSTGGGILPITRIDDAPIGQGDQAGKPGPITHALHQAYWAAHTRPQWYTPVRYKA